MVHGEHPTTAVLWTAAHVKLRLDVVLYIVFVWSAPSRIPRCQETVSQGNTSSGQVKGVKRIAVL